MKFDNSFFYHKNYLNLNRNNIFKKILKNCKKSAKNLYLEFKHNSNQVLESFTAQYQKKILEKIKKANFDKNKKNVVIGLGGSSAGAKAISSYLQKDIIFFDDLNYDFFFDFVKKNNIFNYNYFVISKSGDTFETLAILNLLVTKLLKKKKNFPIKKLIYIISDKKNSRLTNFAFKHKLNFIEHNKNIGGRFSVFSETGILPLSLNFKFFKKTEFFLKLLTNQKHQLSLIGNTSIILYLWKIKKFKTYVNLIYDTRFKNFSYWFQQLHAESLGKNGDGLLPYTSICPKDHHSMMQLFLNGPRDKIFNIIKPSKKKYGFFSKLGFSNIEKYKPDTLLEKQFDSVVECFRENNIPHRVISFERYQSSSNIFEIMAYFILETIILGYAVGINPYNQPAVQQIKNKISKD